MDYHWYDFIGNTGVACIIVSYLLLQLGKVDGENVYFSITNAIGASLIIISLYFDYNLSAFVIEGFWLLISMLGIARSIHHKYSV